MARRGIDAVTRWTVGLALLGATCFGCFNGHTLPEDVQPISFDPHAKRVDRITEVTNEMAWRRSPYWRGTDLLAMPVFLAIAQDRTACLIPGEVWVIAKPGDFVTCHDAWRFPRP